MIGQLNDAHTSLTLEEKDAEFAQESVQWLYDQLNLIALPGLEIDEPEGEGEDIHLMIFDADTTQLIFKVYVAKGRDTFRLVTPTNASVDLVFTDILTLLNFTEGVEVLKKTFQKIKQEL